MVVWQTVPFLNEGVRSSEILTGDGGGLYSRYLQQRHEKLYAWWAAVRRIRSFSIRRQRAPEAEIQSHYRRLGRESDRGFCTFFERPQILICVRMQPYGRSRATVREVTPC